MEIDEAKKLFEKIVKDQAGCFEFSRNGFIRIYEEGDKKCECKDCLLKEKEKE